MRRIILVACAVVALGLSAQPGPMQASVRVRAENLYVDAFDPGMIGDTLRVDVEGPTLLALKGEMRFRGADGQDLRFQIDSSSMSPNEFKLELYDSSFCRDNPVLSIRLGTDTVPGLFVHLECGVSSSRAIFNATTAGGTPLDKVALDIEMR